MVDADMADAAEAVEEVEECEEVGGRCDGSEGGSVALAASSVSYAVGDQRARFIKASSSTRMASRSFQNPTLNFSHSRRS
jgi:hypothetical protein